MFDSTDIHYIHIKKIILFNNDMRVNTITEFDFNGMPVYLFDEIFFEKWMLNMTESLIDLTTIFMVLILH